MDINEDVRKLSSKVLKEFQYVINEEKINKFDIVSFVTLHSVENVEKFSQLSLDFINDNPLLQDVFFKKFTGAAEQCFDKNISEEALTFYPKYINLHINNIKEEQLQHVFNLLVQKYCAPQLNMLMDESLQCGIQLIKKFGQQHANQIVQVFDKYLKSNNPEDANKQISAIVFLGICAPFIKNKAIIETVSIKIILLFRNGSHDLQKSLAKCLYDLMNFFENSPALIEKTVQNLPFEPTYEQKRGQAYLISGLLKGLGIAQFEALNMFKYLETDSLDQKKDIPQKESRLLLLQALLDVFGRLFEPYIVKVMKILMFFFGETNEKLKDLAVSCTKLLMSRLTGYGVKIILPTLLCGLDESSWRAKYNNIWALGNMAFCSPKQMSQCLPQIVPSLSNAMSDTHPKIRECANESLTLIGSSIKNPEISEIVDILIKALSDPFDMNKYGLEILLQTRFVHYIDAPSLALVIPIVDYALAQNRETRPKEDACQVVGSISTLIKDPKDILPYMEILVGGLKSALADNNNEVRLFAAKAIGKISNTIGKQNTEIYFRFIKDIIESKTATSIERSGAAQALSEIMCILGLDYFKSQLPIIFEKMSDKQPWVKEGYIGIFVYVPVILKESFNAYIKDVLDATIEYVSDEEEKIREISLRVLRILIQNFGETQTELLCMPISEGLFSSNWRRRNSSAILCAEMLEILQKIVRQESNEMFEENIKRDESTLTYKQKVLHENFMSIYILRADEMEQIRLQCAQIWKNFVSNTPRTLKLGLPILMQKLIYAITKGGVVQAIARTAISNFCQKYGESFFQNVVDSLTLCIKEYKEKIDNQSMRGAILFFGEYCKNLQGLFLKQNQEILTNLLLENLYTKDALLRNSVFSAVKIITEKIGDNLVLKSLLQVIFEKVKQIKDEDPQYEIFAKIFDTLSQSKSERILQFIVPQIFQKPIPPLLIDVITNNAEIFAQIIYKYFRQQGQKSQHIANNGGIGIILEQIFDKNTDQSTKEALIYALNQITVNLDENDSNTFLLFIIDKIQDLNKTYFKNSLDEDQLEIILQISKFYLLNTPIHINEYNKDLINLITPYIFDSSKKNIIKQANPILGSIFAPINRRQYPELLSTFVLSLHTQLSLDKFKDIELIPGFNLGQEEGEGIQSIVEFLTQNIVYNPNKNFNDSMDFFYLLLKYTSLNNLQPFNFKLAGALIRVGNYRLEISEKERILETLVNKGFLQKSYIFIIIN
ncbi:hypothetical protein IMG5_195990 [Ichthyophthirius multifiliis]|uniref:Uncharacterized protein n=1 Tax=Ichthyophthirius multifiliis TaxID=5932 RepID=G0R515_ICHMU|nr:hypothetical protein IMG5_195990 [Ichthyophthirius multifiliis]EGR27417.1 hypothetical protein IMG5_195990 [Ichthyophthirius multifiliis]|eukprot:XP_004024327.1 hypothetical protein IMG5_195990 [Ichthyophthirius multifiliis]